MDEMKLEIKMGEVISISAKFQFSFVVENNGNAYLQVYAYDPTDMRKSGVFARLDAGNYEELKKIVKKTEETIDKLKTSGQMKSMGTSLIRY